MHPWRGVSWKSCCSAMVLFQAPYGCLTPTQQEQRLGCTGRAWNVSRVGARIRLYSCKALAMRDGNRHQKHAENHGWKTENPRETQFLGIPHENPCVAGGQEGGELGKSRGKHRITVCCSRRSCC